MEAIFEPRSVAVYGASRDERKLGHVLLRNALTGGFDGPVVAVNPAGGEVLGVRAVPALVAPVDLALVSVPAAAAEAAVADAAGAGCGAAIVLASGFGETGAAGAALERRLARIAAAAGMRLVGPNCMGVVSRHPRGWLNGSYFWRLPERAGGISLVSQSGAFGGMFFAEARRRGLGVARFLSVGNSADVTESDALEWLAGDPATRVVGVFAEAFRDGRRFVAAAERCGRPVVALKAGTGRAGARAAASHTGSLAGRHGAVRAALAGAGVIEAASSDEFFDVLQALEAGVRGGRSVAVLTISGGPGVLASDAAERLGLRLPPPGEATVRRIRELAPAFAAAGNPIDLTPQCPPAGFRPAIAAVFDDPAYDGVVVINCGLDIPEFGQGVAAAVRRTGKPAVAFVVDVPRVEAELAAAGVPLLPSPERAVAAYAAGIPSPPEAEGSVRGTASASTSVSTSTSGAVPPHPDPPPPGGTEERGREVLSEWESKALLGDVPRPREALTRTRTEAVAFAAQLPSGVVAKASGPGHKTERGGVRLDADVAAVWNELAALGDGTVLVAEVVRGELELIAGGLRDPQFGAVLSIGLGGVAAEALDDVAFLLAPAAPGELDRALARLRCAPLLDGHRGRPPVDRAALGRILDAIAVLLARDPDVVEVDVNPIVVRDGCPMVVDALVVIQASNAAASKGSARAGESVFPRSRTSHTDPEGCAGGAPDVPDGGGVLEGGARPPLPE